MRRIVPLLGCLFLLVLAACGTDSFEIRNSNGRIVGTIDVQGVKTAVLLNTHGDVLGKVRGKIIRDDAGKNVGNVAERDGSTVILGPGGDALGTVQDGDCYGKGNGRLGSVSGAADAEAAAAACLLFFLR